MHASFIILAAAATSVFAQDACVAKCNTAYDACRGAPGANQSFCGAEFSKCLGYSPFSSTPNGTYVEPTACSTSVAPTATADACVSKCNTAYDACRGAPGANQSFCGAEFSKCLGYSPFSSTPGGTYVAPTACSTTAAPTATGDACVAKCVAAADACRVAPQANQSFCSAQFANCLGYNPYGVGPTASYVAPTACSTGATGSATATSKPTGSNNGTTPSNPTPAPTFVPANGASSVQGGLVGAVGLVAALLL